MFTLRYNILFVELNDGKGIALGNMVMQIGSLLRRAYVVYVFLMGWNAVVLAQSTPSADELFRGGQYDDAAQLARIEVERGVWNEKWPKLLILSQLARGQYSDALATYDQAVSRYSQSLSLRLLGRDVYLANNRRKDAEREADQIFNTLQRSSSRFASAESLVAAGRYFVLRGEDARQVLTMFYDRVRQADPKNLDAHLATAELAIVKGDFKEAAKTLAIAEQIDELDPRVGFLQAKAWESSDWAKATAAIQTSLNNNPHFTPSLLLMVDNAIDSERYETAEELVTKVLNVNPHDWAAWSYLAVIAHLRGQYEIEGLMRAAALSTWTTNPAVDHLIGRKLSDNYRFAEGAAYQRRAIAMDTDYGPAKFQLAQDLLRLGDDKIGWEIAGEVSQADPYNVVVHNLMTLSDRLKKFTSIESEGIIVRMDSEEANIYGDRVLSLLIEAKRKLCEKYDVTPRSPIVVELYPEQKDFAIRTFGLPGGAGFLGVCFGRVITANSPASQGNRPSNWEAVLWHEFCHAITLEKTKNRMPRWLSEGISVYEESEQDASWGQAITPIFREMLLADDLTPVSKLSGSFLKPSSPMHLQFAYFQSSIVVRFLVNRFGHEKLNQLLVELGNGLPINEAIGRTMRGIETIDDEFALYAKEIANSFAKDATWDRNETDNVWKKIEKASGLVAQQKWEQAAPLLQALVDEGVVYPERDGPLEQLATVYEKLDDPKNERIILRRIDGVSNDALPSILRLMAIGRREGDWESLLRYSNKSIAIDPLRADGYEGIAQAATELNRPAEAAQSLRTLAVMKPLDPADIYLRLAKAQFELGEKDLAKRSVLSALEIAPRYRDAHRWLLKITENSPVEIPPVEIPPVEIPPVEIPPTNEAAPS